MYSVNPVPKAETTDLPTNMYRVPFLYDVFENGGRASLPAKQTASSPQSVNPAGLSLKDVISKQERLIEELNKLEIKVIEQVTGKPFSVAGNSSKNDDKEPLNNLLKRQERLLQKLTTLEQSLKQGNVSSASTSGIAITVQQSGGFSHDERMLQHLLKRQERILNNLTDMEIELTKLTGCPVVEQKVKQEATTAKVAAIKSTSKSPASTLLGDFSIHCDVHSPPKKVLELIQHLAKKEKKKVLSRFLYHSSVLEQTSVERQSNCPGR
ncbi:hypothetical protein HDE_10456 [Halotydeus destructor]|nr:hypothetical protein HDE_10456 [Halotydeus destructor]